MKTVFFYNNSRSFSKNKLELLSYDNTEVETDENQFIKLNVNLVLFSEQDQSLRP